MRIDRMPLITMEELYHVGTFDATQKRKGSYEGAGLSISTEPDAWRRINPMTTGHTFEMRKKNNQFLDYYALDEKQKDSILEWGLQAGYITKCPLYRVTFIDGETEELCYFIFETKEEALAEAEDCEEAVTCVDGFRSTKKMDEAVLSSRPTFDNFDLLVTLYADEVLEIDGVYWFEELDIYAYSAPRGVIVKRQVPTWEAVLIEG